MVISMITKNGTRFYVHATVENAMPNTNDWKICGDGELVYYDRANDLWITVFADECAAAKFLIDNSKIEYLEGELFVKSAEALASKLIALANAVAVGVKMGY